MRKHLPEKVELGRVVNYFGPDAGRTGRFMLQGPCGCRLQVLSDDGSRTGWEQVSVSTLRHRSPNWSEMCFVKDLFWDEEECVIQFHPPLSQYVKNDRYCLHLWRPTQQAIPAPPASLVGVVGVGPHEAKVWSDGVMAEIVRMMQQERFGGVA